MRHLFVSTSRALLVVLTVALVADAVLGALTATLGAVAGPAGAPWWVQGHVPERARWLVFALLVRFAAARVGSAAEALPARLPEGDVWRLVGRLAIVVPLLWLIALWLVQAAIFTAADRWDIDGQAYLNADYYRRVFAGYVPWMLGGGAAVVASHHVR